MRTVHCQVTIGDSVQSLGVLVSTKVIVLGHYTWQPHDLVFTHDFTESTVGLLWYLQKRVAILSMQRHGNEPECCQSLTTWIQS